MKRRHAQRAADVGTERKRPITGSERRRRAAGRAARRAAEVIGIVGGAVDVVVTLPVAEPDRHIGLAEDHAAGFFHPRNRQRVFRGPVILLRHKAPCRGQAGDVVGFLHGQGNAEQRLLLAARQRGVGFARGFRPRSKSRTQIALILPSWRSMRPMASLASSTADTFFALSAADASTAVLKLHCDLAKAVLLLCLAGLQEMMPGSTSCR